ncbi:MAG: hypothetical protein K6G50_10100, partial [bacterium]|nr:hypothetical protein [bacterium]
MRAGIFIIGGLLIVAGVFGFFLYSHHIETKQFGSKAAIVGDFGENPEYDAKILKIKEKEKETRE